MRQIQWLLIKSTNSGSILTLLVGCIMHDIAAINGDFSQGIQTIKLGIEGAIENASKGLNDVKTNQNVHKSKVTANYIKILRELQKDKVDSAEFAQLKRQIEELTPLKAHEIWGRP